MRWHFFWGIMATMLIANLSQGEYFRYLDQNGVVSYTDDLSNVPQDQRTELESFHSVKSKVEEIRDQTQEEQKHEETKEIIKKDTFSLNESAPAVENTYSQELTDLKGALDREFVQLNVARAALLVDQQKIGNQMDVLQFNEKAKELNDRIKSFESKKEAYLKKIARSNGVKEP